MANLTEIVAALNLPLGDLTFEDDILIGTQRGDRIVRPLEAGEFAFGTLAPDALPVNLSLFPGGGGNLVVGTSTTRDDGDDQV